MKLVLFLFTFVLTLVLGPGALAATTPAMGTKVIIQVDLSARMLRVEKLSGNTKKHLDSRTLPVVKDSMKAGWHRPSSVKQVYRPTRNGTYLENMISFNGSRSLRSSRYFEQMATDKVQTSGTIIVEPDFGMILFDTVKRYGTSNTWIYIRK
ncbi:MAG: hypothetical protein KF799_07390 [Bdellovibrionales bacterium]|nr:hypothetical protein [Bdellovibrionales bacterium]